MVHWRRAVNFYLTAALVLTGLILGLGAAPAQAAKQEKYASIVVDANDGKVLYSRNADAFRFPASLTKMMTLYLIFDAIDEGRLKETDILKASSQAAAQPPSKLGLKAGETLTVDQAIRALVTKSANDVAVVLAEAHSGSEKAFARDMTQKAREIGMSRTTFRNASGLPDPNQRTTARDMATLGRALMIDHQAHYDYFSLAEFNWRGVSFANHNKLLGRYDGTTGLKTGYTRASGFNLATSVERDGYNLIAVVLGGRTSRSRDDHMMQLLDLQFARLRKSPLLASRGPLPTSLPSASTLSVASSEAGGTNAASLSTSLASLIPRPRPGDAPASTGTAAAALSSDPIGETIAALTLPPAGEVVTASVASQFVSDTGSVGEGDTEDNAADIKVNDWLAKDRYWGIQIGAFAAMESAAARLSAAAALAPDHLADATPAILPSQKGKSTLYRARFGPFEETEARAACEALKTRGIQCAPVRDADGPAL